MTEVMIANEMFRQYLKDFLVAKETKTKKINAMIRRNEDK